MFAIVISFTHFIFVIDTDQMTEAKTSEETEHSGQWGILGK
jgi:hypothetical protein